MKSATIYHSLFGGQSCSLLFQSSRPYLLHSTKPLLGLYLVSRGSSYQKHSLASRPLPFAQRWMYCITSTRKEVFEKCMIFGHFLVFLSFQGAARRSATRIAMPAPRPHAHVRTYVRMYCSRELFPIEFRYPCYVVYIIYVYGMLHYSLWEMPVRGRTVTRNLK